MTEERDPIKRLVLASLVVVLGWGCGGKTSPDATPSRARDALSAPTDATSSNATPNQMSSWDNREREALEGSGRGLPDTRTSPDTGINIPDTEAALLDEPLCREACDHLFELLLEEKRGKLADDRDELMAFENDLIKVREKREKVCIKDCRRYADLPTITCIKAARSRKALDACDLPSPRDELWKTAPTPR